MAVQDRDETSQRVAARNRTRHRVAGEGPDLPSEPDGVKFSDLLSYSSPAALCFRTIAGAVTGTGLELIYVLSGAATLGRQ